MLLVFDAVILRGFFVCFVRPFFVLLLLLFPLSLAVVNFIALVPSSCTCICYGSHYDRVRSWFNGRLLALRPGGLSLNSWLGPSDLKALREALCIHFTPLIREMVEKTA